MSRPEGRADADADPSGEADVEAAVEASADLRVPLLAVVAWAGALLGLLLPWWVLGATVVGGLGAALALGHRRDRGPAYRWTVLALLAVLVATGTVAGVREQRLERDPVAGLAAAGATVSGRAVVVGDPRTTTGPFGDQVLVRLRVVEVQGRGRVVHTDVPVLAMAARSTANGDASGWDGLALGSRIAFAGRLVAADGRVGDLSALLRARGDPVVVTAPDVWWRGAARVRAALRASVEHRPAEEQVLVPSLVVGDDAGLDPDLADDFRTTGLTHLLAVSGTNLTLILGFLLVLARWCRVRGRGLLVVGALGVVGFVLLARTEPSVVRAAAMGVVGLVGMGGNGRRRGTRALGVAVLGLLLLDPWLAVSVGFALSVVATAGILLLAPGWRDALARWLPRWAAEAVAVPAAAQLACTPIVAAVSGQVSLVAVAANLLVAPVVGPATVLGLCGGLVGLVSTSLSRLPGTAAAWCVAWIVLVARRGAEVPGAALTWGTGVPALAVLTLLCVALVVLGPLVLRHRVPALLVATVAVVLVVVPLPRPGWPPPDWRVVACDVGQGDAVVLRAGPHRGVLVDAGPDPAAVDRCLTGLGITALPLVVLTHFHDDHVAGFAGAVEGRALGRVLVSPLAEPPGAAADVTAAAEAAGVRPEVAAYGSVVEVGDVVVQVVGPGPDDPTRRTAAVAPADGGGSDGPDREGGAGGGEGSGPNDASVVLVAVVGGVRVLLTGDVEPEAQAGLDRRLPADLRVDVLKVPHHGSRHQDPDLLSRLGARVALVSVGADNTYGHPAPPTLDLLRRAGMRVLRTDRSGDVAVTGTPDHLATVRAR